MNRTLLSVSALALAATLSACGGRDEAANNFAAENDTNAMAAASNPFADAEKQMNDKMMAAVGSDAGQNWAKKMIEHHGGAIAMSRIMLDQNPSADVAKMARDSIDNNEKDIADIKKLVQDGPSDQKSSELYRPAMMDMQQNMMSAKGADASEMFMRKMLEHHKGAVAMSDVALKNGVSGALRAQVEKTKKMNQDDSKMTEAMLAGKPMDQAKADASPATPSKASSSTSKAMPVPGTNTTEREVHDMNAMNNM